MRACYYYDGQSSWGNAMVNQIGHLTTSYGVTHAGTMVSGAESFNWDSMGRLQGQMQCTPSTCAVGKGYPVYGTFDLLGNMTSSWDSSVGVYAAYDGANRLNSVTAGLGVNAGTPGPGAQQILNVATFSPFGGLLTATVGSSPTLSETRSYNPARGWLGSILVKNGGTQIYSLSGPSSGLINYAYNGNVLGVIDSVNGSWTYTYDGVNRLSTAVATGHSFAYSYTADGTTGRYGNMTCVDNGSQHSACTPTGITFNAANNRINSSGYTYDSNGNLLTTNALMRAMIYDTENRSLVTGTPVEVSAQPVAPQTTFMIPMAVVLPKRQARAPRSKNTSMT